MSVLREIKFELPIWSRRFDFVNQAVDTPPDDDRILVFFDANDNGMDLADEFRNHLHQVFIDHDEIRLRDYGQQTTETVFMLRHKKIPNSQTVYFERESLEWTRGDSNMVDLLSLNRMFKDDPQALWEYVRSNAIACGSDIPSIGAIKCPNDDELFARALIGRDEKLVRELATPERLNSPMRLHIHCHRPLYEAIDMRSPLTPLLLALGANPLLTIGTTRDALSNQIIADHVRTEDDIPNDVRCLVASAVARQSALDAISAPAPSVLQPA